MVPIKIPRMEKNEYDQLIADEYISRIAFKGENIPISHLSSIFLMKSSCIF